MKEKVKQTWNQEKNGLYIEEIKSEWEKLPWGNQKNRKIEIVMAKLRIGHACTNAYLARFKLKDSPFCRHCVLYLHPLHSV